MSYSESIWVQYGTFSIMMYSGFLLASNLASFIGVATVYRENDFDVNCTESIFRDIQCNTESNCMDP